MQKLYKYKDNKQQQMSESRKIFEMSKVKTNSGAEDAGLSPCQKKKCLQYKVYM